jgi:hypothetical protein
MSNFLFVQSDVLEEINFDSFIQTKLYIRIMWIKIKFARQLLLQKL